MTFFSTLSLALRIPSRSRLAEQFEKHGKGRDFDEFLTFRSQYLLATAALRSALMIAVVVVILRRFAVFEGDANLFNLWLALVVVWLLIVVFSVAIPNAWARHAGEVLIVRMFPVLVILRLFCLPLVRVLEVFDPLVRRLAGVPAGDAESQAEQLEKEILNVVSEGEKHGAVDEEEKEMIESVIELSDTQVEEIMTPRTDIVALAKNTDLDTTLETIKSKGHSRIPIYDGTIDTILGILYVKDMLRRSGQDEFSLAEMKRDALFIPESKPVRDLLREFQTKRVHIAVVLDEYGGTAGLVTIEDILEELVGEITDEYDANKPAQISRVNDHVVEVDARMSIDDLNDELDLNIPDEEDYETLGGFVFSKLGRVPDVGDECEHDEVGIRVTAADARRVLRVQLEWPVRENSQDSTGSGS